METELTLEEIPFDGEDLEYGLSQEDLASGFSQEEAALIIANRRQQEEMLRVAKYLMQLKKAGYYKGKIDGIWGRLTRNAYEQYSKDSLGKGNRAFVQNGDTLSRIANRYEVSVLQIAAINPLIEDINKIYAGDVINLPYFAKTSTSNSKSSSKSNASTGDIAYENLARPIPEAVVTVKRSNSSKPSQTLAKPILANNSKPAQASNSEYVLYKDFPIGPAAEDLVNARISDPGYSPYERSKNAFTFKETTDAMRWRQDNAVWDKITLESPTALKYNWKKPYYISYNNLY